MTEGFSYSALPVRVLFGEGCLQALPAEVERLAWRRVMLLCTVGQRSEAQAAASLLGERLAIVHDGARMHVPVETVTLAVHLAQANEVDGLVCYGGGSTIGLAKAIALQTRLPILAVPTTYAGSEMTPIYGITDAGLKRTGRDPAVQPCVVLYDPLLSRRLPVPVSVASGLNAMAHAAEALYARDANPVATMMAEEGLRALSRSLPRLVACGDDPRARSDALYGAWLCGTVLGSVGMALHHKLCHTLGGSFGMPHAETHAVVLPHALAYNAPAARGAMRRLGAALAVEDAPARLFAMLGELKVPTSLKALGLSELALDEVVEVAMSKPYWNPRPLQRAELRALLQRAWEGSAPPACAITAMNVPHSS